MSCTELGIGKQPDAKKGKGTNIYADGMGSLHNLSICVHKPGDRHLSRAEITHATANVVYIRFIEAVISICSLISILQVGHIGVGEQHDGRCRVRCSC
jgi:hypothetical protein